MRLGKTMVAVTGMIWTLYGAWLFVDPKGLSYAGFSFPNWSVTVEVVAMYGGFEFMLGLFTLAGLLRPAEYLKPVMLLWAMLYTGLVVGRIYGILAWGGSFHVTLGGLPESYNPGAMVALEIPSATLFWVSLWLTRREPSREAVLAGRE